MNTKTKIHNGYLVNGVRITKRKTFWIIAKHDINPNYIPAGNPWVMFRTLGEAMAAVSKDA